MILEIRSFPSIAEIIWLFKSSSFIFFYKKELYNFVSINTSANVKLFMVVLMGLLHKWGYLFAQFATIDSTISYIASFKNNRLLTKLPTNTPVQLLVSHDLSFKDVVISWALLLSNELRNISLVIFQIKVFENHTVSIVFVHWLLVQ